MVKLDQAQPRGVELMSDEELDPALDERLSSPAVQAWLADEGDSDPLRLAALQLTRKQR
jgi:hypothetical protein